VWADRHSRKLLIIGADLAIAVSTLALAGAFLAGRGELWMVFGALAVRSAGAGIHTPAVGALLPQIVPTDHLMRVNGITTSLHSGMMLLSPAVAAALYAGFGLTAGLFVDVVTALVGVTLLALLRVPPLERCGAPVGYLADLRAGLGYVRRHRLVRRVIVFYALVFFLVVPPAQLTPLMVVRSFGEEVWMLTATEVAFSVGMIAGGAALAAWGGLRDRIVMLTWSSIALGALSVAMGLSSTLLVFLVFMLLTGLAVPAFSTTSHTMLQETVEPQVLGRVFGVLGIVIALATPAGMAVFGPLADVTSVESLLVIGGLLMVAVGLAVRIGAPEHEHASGEDGLVGSGGRAPAPPAE
jgi:DHA3 family macrolide efflux protein-like MFS transporter